MDEQGKYRKEIVQNPKLGFFISIYLLSLQNVSSVNLTRCKHRRLNLNAI